MSCGPQLTALLALLTLALDVNKANKAASSGPLLLHAHTWWSRGEMSWEMPMSLVNLSVHL